MQTGASSALKKLRDKLTLVQPIQVPGSSQQATRAIPSTKTFSSVIQISKAETHAALPKAVDDSDEAIPPKALTEAGTTRSKSASLVSALQPPSKAHPLRSLSTNTETRRTIPIRPSAPIEGAKLNKYGCYEIEVDEFDLRVTFPESSNFEVWDQEDELFIVGPISLHLTLKDTKKWDLVPISHPDIHIRSIKCSTKAVVDSPSYPYTISASEADKYNVVYQGSKARDALGKELAINPAAGSPLTRRGTARILPTTLPWPSPSTCPRTGAAEKGRESGGGR
ncbi:hypothetical protein B0H10DRAFT_1297829 [Mycena sp. CBHHK59/15]|nr:hypothetical protein B0H10DRAFT_1297829 [Mycena sp. CBHHK59/15]